MSHLSPDELTSILSRLLAVRERVLVRRPVDDILSAIDHVVSRFLDPTSAERQEAEARLPEETGLSPAMIRHTLPLLFREYQGGKLRALLDDELGAANRLDRCELTQTGKRGVFGLPLIVQILAGNIPAAGIDSVIFALLVKSATLVKTASSSGIFPVLFARALTEVDQDLADCLAVTTWPGGASALEEIAFRQADIVVASGSDENLASIRQRVRGRFIGYGHKVSFSMIGKEALTRSPQLTRNAAYDVALFDQQGCLSPQLIYVEEGGEISPKEFAALLAQELAHWQQELPRGVIPPDASAMIRRVRDEIEWQALSGKDVALYASTHGTEWTVIYDAEPAFVPSPLYRTIRVKSLSTLSQLTTLLASHRSYLEAVGIAVGEKRLSETARILGQAGVSRVCPIGSMQLPPLSWRHGGRPRVADLVRWVEMEYRLQA